MRVGTIGVNIVFFNQTTNHPPVSKSKMAPDDKFIISAHDADNSLKTADHLKNYAFTCPCHVAGGGTDMMVYIPGNGINHRVGGNTRKVCRRGGCDLVAVRDIPKGEPLGIDYNSFGRAPRWHTDMLREIFGTDECIFAGLNDFVGEK